MTNRPAVWQRLPDITPNYGGALDRRSKLTSTSHSHEAAVIIRDNASTAHKLILQLSTLKIERSKTMRLLDTNKQSFIARQLVKQRHLDRAGITDVSLLPRRLMLLTTMRSNDEKTSKLREATVRRNDVTEVATSITGNSLPVIINERTVYDGNTPLNGGDGIVNDAPVPSATSLEVDFSNRSVKSHTLTQFTGGATIDVTSSFMTHNFRRHPGREVNDSSSPRSPARDHENNAVLAAAVSARGGGAVPGDTSDRRFLSLMSSLSTRSPSGVDSYIQLSPSGSLVLGRYATPACDLNRVRQAIEANHGTARLRYIRSVTANPVQVPNGNRVGRARRHGQVVDASELLIRAKTDIVHSFTNNNDNDELIAIPPQDNSVTAWVGCS